MAIQFSFHAWDKLGQRSHAIDTEITSLIEGNKAVLVGQIRDDKNRMRFHYLVYNQIDREWLVIVVSEQKDTVITVLYPTARVSREALEEARHLACDTVPIDLNAKPASRLPTNALIRPKFEGYFGTVFNFHALIEFTLANGKLHREKRKLGWVIADDFARDIEVVTSNSSVNDALRIKLDTLLGPKDRVVHVTVALGKSNQTREVTALRDYRKK